ncbi:hypothetical protein LTR10_012609 [Elasticomyces elasticus]|uniref:Heterokaryon incompatibility domain-containing protein n=1 Tax=Exophiala sideris TaxID=1016849 RepID=A0ABR0JRG5_9EURO|nr:hypothetical protein LTR10_012609 [Elasticomyces elasticus]KAK5040190.1 hypothetical protein LTS07_000687 [Exophiala sideris]KAK5043384.1 hypothetical protein LTR13_001155 [Exophiala sideris]KAK5068568.1 hypothetical protein LTR69_000688 [Exophiala sideris]KAK5186166.1 hypothetical protein LTR44_001221 [Eurotiomycetes sp. CCFEE 6388]
MVCIWLGEPSESSSLGMSLLGGVEGDYFDWLREQPLNADYVLKYAQALKDILSRPWWSRLWPAQEFALAPASIFMCGSHWFDSAQLVKDDDLTSMIGTLHGNGLSDDLSMSLHDLQANSFTQTTTIKALWHHMSSQKPSKKAEIFLEILKRCAGRHCFDDRDRVFALLGLSPEPVAWSVNANYDSSVPEVYEDLAANVIRHFDSLAVLITAGLGLQTEPDLPSWVPDWRNFHMLVQPRWYGECGTTFSAFANKRHAWACGDNQLRVKGVRLGTIPSVGLGVVCKPMLNSLMADYEIVFRRALRSWMGLCDVATREGGMDSYLNGSSKAEAFYRTVYGDVESTMYPGGYTNCVRLQTSDVQATVSNVDWAERLGRYDGERIGPEGQHVPPYVGARRLFVTDTGYFGNGGPSVEPGDQVFILMGCDYPAILRPMDYSTPQCTMYKLVETCYVHGVMDGELFEGASLFEVSESSEEDDIRTYLAWVEELGDHVIEPVWLC